MFGLRQFIRKFKVALGRLREIFLGLSEDSQYHAWDARRKILLEDRYQNSKRLQRFGHKVYSQGDEDGIIQAIFDRIGSKTSTFLEIGIGNGLENNTLNLLIKGWKGVWIDTDRKTLRGIRKSFKTMIDSDHLSVHRLFVSLDNVTEIQKLLPAGELDLLSLYIDGNDLHLIPALVKFKPRVFVFEYNSKFDASTDWVMAYNGKHVWDGSDYFGASLKAFERVMEAHKYTLVGCSLTGINAFFVRNDLLGDHFHAPYTSEEHYEPMRYWLGHGLKSGHPAKFGPFVRALDGKRE